MKKITYFLALALSAVFTQVAAADAVSALPDPASIISTFDGQYEGQFKGELRGKSYVKFVSVSIKGAVGTWQAAASRAGNNCLGQAIQFTVATVTVDTLTFVNEYSKVLNGCHDSKVTLMKVGGNVLKGTLDSEGVIHPLELKKIVN
jgi:hypothetical protein